MKINLMDWTQQSAQLAERWFGLVRLLVGALGIAIVAAYPTPITTLLLLWLAQYSYTLRGKAPLTRFIRPSELRRKTDRKNASLA